MPESKVRKSTEQKQKLAREAQLAEKRADRRRLSGPVDRSWVPWVFVPVGLLGVLWLVVYYIAGNQMPVMSALGGWNILIGMGMIGASFSLMTLWK